MNREHPQRRRRARAIALSESVGRAAAMRAMMAVAGLAALVEVALIAQRLWAVPA